MIFFKPVWFGVDFGKHSQQKIGILDLNVYNTQLFFKSQFPCQDKASRLEYGESLMTHAMIFTGIHVEKRSSDDDSVQNSKTFETQPDGLRIVRYRVENSHGDDKGEKGYIVMTDSWFDEYLYEIVVDKKFLTNDILAVLEQEPIRLPAWDPMGALAN